MQINLIVVVVVVVESILFEFVSFCRYSRRLQNSRVFFSKSVKKSVKRGVRIVLARSARASSGPFQTFCLTARAYLNTQIYGLFCSLLQPYMTAFIRMLAKMPPVRARAAGEGLGTQKRNVKFIKMRKLTMFITAVCVLLLIKLRWPKNKSLYDRWNGQLPRSANFCWITLQPSQQEKVLNRKERTGNLLCEWNAKNFDAAVHGYTSFLVC